MQTYSNVHKVNDIIDNLTSYQSLQSSVFTHQIWEIAPQRFGSLLVCYLEDFLDFLFYIKSHAALSSKKKKISYTQLNFFLLTSGEF